MSYNPLSKEYNTLHSEILNLTETIKAIEDALEWYEGNVLENYLLKEKRLSNAISDKENQKTNLHDDYNKLQRTGWIIKPYIFSPIAAIKQNRISRSIKPIKKKIERLSVELETLHDAIENFKSFDREAVLKKLRSQKSKLNNKQKPFISLKTRKEKIDSDLKPLTDKIHKMEKRLKQSENTLESAEIYDKKLSLADEPYERAILHQECETDLGEGKPHIIIEREKRIIGRIKRDLKKVKKRAYIKGKQSAKFIKKLIIDGNNFCYEGSKFVGLEPLKQLTSEIHSQYPNIIIVFDAAIRSMMKMDDNQLNKQFNENINIHVVASSQLADETVLDLASDNKNSYVISNDRFADFKEKEAVSGKRIIRHEIVDDRILIHDLNIRLTY